MHVRVGKNPILRNGFAKKLLSSRIHYSQNLLELKNPGPLGWQLVHRDTRKGNYDTARAGIRLPNKLSFIT